MRTNLLLFTLVLISVISCRKAENNDLVSSTSSQLNGQTKAAARAANPFTGSLSYSPVSGNPLPCACSPYYDLGNFAGAGTLSHLGYSTSVIHPCVSPIMSGSTQIGSHVAIECAYFAAANGDTVFLYTHPYNLMGGATASSGTVTVDITSGTGRFAGATGSFTGTVTVPYGSGNATLSGINGTINY